MLTSNTNKRLIYTSLATLLAICFPIILAPQATSNIINNLFGLMTNNLGWLILLSGFVFVTVMVYVGLSHYGKIKLGNQAPEYSNFEWASMLFCAGIGSGIIYWSVIEWGYYVDGPPLGVEARSTAAWEWASTYGIFHWGPAAWAFYGISSLAISYLMHVRKSNVVSMSHVCQPILKDKTDGPIGETFNIIYVFGLLAAVGTSLGLGTSLISASVNNLTGIEKGFGLDFGIIAIVAVLFAWSVHSGLEGGIRKLSVYATNICLLLLVYTLLTGPTLFMLKSFLNSLGLLMDNFFRMMLWTDPIENSGFVNGWTVFYWAWWAVYGPFMGMFIARISRGRTVRQVVFGTLGWGTLGCAIFFGIIGNYAMNLEITETLKVTTLLKDVGAPATIVEVFKTLPMGTIVVIIATLAAVLLLATTFDSASYTLAMISSKKIKTDEDPDKSLRLFWAVAISVLPIALLFLGGLKPLQTSSIVMAVPVILILFATIFSFFKMVKEDQK